MHLGIGATIGSVIATHKAIIPAAVVVDTGCGMVAARLSLTANDMDEKALKKVFDPVQMTSTVERGSRFRIVVPLAPAPGPSPMPSTQTPTRPLQALPGRVLLIDDGV